MIGSVGNFKDEEGFLSRNNIDIDDVVISYASDGKPYSYYGDDRWVILSEGLDVNFGILEGEFKLVGKKLLYKFLIGNSFLSKKSVGKKYVQGFRILSKCIIECGGINFAYLNSDKGFRKFVRVAKSKQLKYKTWKNYLIIFNLLKSEGVISRSLASADELAFVLSNNQRIIHQTIALPENIASCYFKNALDAVTKFHSKRKLISDTYRDFIQDYNDNIELGDWVAKARGKAQRNYIEITSNNSFVLDLRGEWLSWLRGACYVVIAGFTGCRDGEIKAFTLDSYQEKEYSGMVIPVVNGIHTKANIGGVKRNVSWVTIPAVKEAIELVWDMYEFCRSDWKQRAKLCEHIDEEQKMIEGADSLFISYAQNATSPAASRQAMDNSLKSFVKSTGYKAVHDDVTEFNLLNPSRKGELSVNGVLTLNPHCFRRTFAVYLVRNKLASLLDLKYQFRHINIAMTAWYSNQADVASYFDMMLDKELLHEIAQENHEFMTDTLYYIYNEAESLSGIEGKRIEQLRGEDRSTIYLSREEISKQIKEGQISIVETPVGHCTNPQCDRICDMPVCKYAVVTKDKALQLQPKRRLLIDKFERLITHGVNMPNILSKIYYEIKSIEECFNDHGITFDVYHHDINHTLLVAH